MATTIVLLGTVGVLLGSGGAAAQNQEAASTAQAIDDLVVAWSLHEGGRDAEMAALQVLASEERDGSLVIVGRAPDPQGQARGIAATFERDDETGLWELVELLDRPNGDDPWFDVVHTADDEAVLVRANGGHPGPGDLRNHRGA